MSIWEMARNSGGVYVRPLFVRLAGDLVTGALLSQLAYWFTPGKNGKTKLTIQLDGKLWLAKTREEACAECCITPDQFRRAVKVLCDKGFLETKVKKFVGHNATHFWLNESAMADTVVNWGSSLDTTGDHAELSNGDNPELTTGDHADYFTETTTGDYAEITVMHDGQENIKKDTKGEVLVDAEQVLAKSKQKLWANTAGGNALRWKSRMGTMYGFQKDILLSERAMLKAVMGTAGERTPDLLDYVTQNWSKYANYVRQKMGYSTVQVVPTIGFLLKYVDLGLHLIALIGQTPVAQVKKVKFEYEDEEVADE